MLLPLLILRALGRFNAVGENVYDGIEPHNKIPPAIFIVPGCIIFAYFIYILKSEKQETVIPVEIAGRYYSSGLITMLKMAIAKDEDTSVDEYLGFYKSVMSHTIYEII